MPPDGWDRSSSLRDPRRLASVSDETDRVWPVRARGVREIGGVGPLTGGVWPGSVSDAGPNSQKWRVSIRMKSKKCESRVESKKWRVDPRMGRGRSRITKVGVSIREERARIVSG